MKYVKLFHDTSSANGFIIKNIPWIAWENQRERAFVCNELNKKIIVDSSGNIELVSLLPPNNEIWYTTTDNSIYDFGTIIQMAPLLDERYVYGGPELLTNTYDNKLGLWRMVFANDVINIGITSLVSEKMYFNPVFVDYSEQGLSCNINNLYLPNSITTIGILTLATPSLPTFIIPCNVYQLHGWAFSANVNNLFEIKVDPNNQKYYDIDGVLFSKNSNYLFYYPSAKIATHYNIPNGTCTIGEDSFVSCNNLISITIPNTVTTIEIDAIRNCQNLESITILATTPPTNAGGNFGNANIYVSEESLQTYKSEWPAYADRIYSI